FHTQQHRSENISRQINSRTKKIEIQPVSLHEKISRKLNTKFLKYFEKTSFYPWFYRSKWHTLISKAETEHLNQNAYLTARPNPGAGIGHQMANWIAGHHIARIFGLHYAHSPFPDPRWESFLGFGRNCITADELYTDRNYKRVRLPRFDLSNDKENTEIKSIISSYGSKTCFLCEQDQWFRALHEEKEILQKKFYSAPSRKDHSLLFNKERTSIAAHIRRGDICQKDNKSNPNLTMRWLDNEYFIQILDTVTEQLRDKRKYEIFLFSQGKEIDFKEFKKFDNFQLCNEMSAIDSFNHMTHADILITSRSSFSYKPALLNRGIKICPPGFWHTYPDTPDWIEVQSYSAFQEKISHTFLI
ncbi:MAG: alpha-1,2-fucosyltransferase, partial [Puniceicoccales bacterium]